MRKRILVVDDDEMNLKRTRMILEKYYNVLLAESGREALEKIRTEKVDLILLDIAMPKMDGIETFKRNQSGRSKLSEKTIFPEGAVEASCKGA